MQKKADSFTSIGGQAVIEGVMMKGSSSMVTAVRDDLGEIRVEKKRIKPVKDRNIFFKLPLVRGVVSFINSIFGGTKTLIRSAEIFGESEPSKFESWLAKKTKISVMSIVALISVILGLFVSLFLFIWLPVNFTFYLQKWTGVVFSVWAKNFIEGGVKLLIFIAYILFCTLFKDVRRVFMYHGAEHKTITCYEKGLELTTENAKKCSRVHPRCGTTFMVFVMLISIVLFAVFESVLATNSIVLSKFLRVLCKIMLVPFVAGISYELLKGLAKTNSPIFLSLKLPGFLLQKITTKEPDDEMLEVAITAFKGVLEMDSDKEAKEQGFFSPMPRNELLKKVKTILNDNGITESSEAEWLLALCLNVKRGEVFSNDEVSVSDVKKINLVLRERISGRPLWYCIGNTEFYGYKINVDESVLIPRPETELLVDIAKKHLNKKSTVLDLCTGSGAIAIAIKKGTDAKVFAIDVSAKALRTAEKNAKENSADITFIKSDMFTELARSKDNKFDLIVSNPPYVRSLEIETLQKEVKDFEPRKALDGGEDGLDFYRIIGKKAKEYLNENGVLLLECGFTQANAVSKLIENAKEIEIIKDYGGNDRIVKAVF